MKIKRDEDGWIKVGTHSGGLLRSQSVEANLLYEILQKLEEALERLEPEEEVDYGDVLGDFINSINSD